MSKGKNKGRNLQRNNDSSAGGTLTAVSRSFSGPLPPPNVLKGYEDIQPGFANRIITMAESQSQHRQDLEQSIVKSNIRNEKQGMWMSFLLTLFLMSTGFYLIYLDKETAAYFAIFGPVLFHATNYIYNKRREEKTLEENKKENVE